jgi:hypothetical protein
MWKQIAIGGAVAAAIVGAGTAALATSGSPVSSGTPATSGESQSTAAPAGRHARLGSELARHALHGQFVTQNPKTKQFVTHDVIRGSVTAVSATSITVQAADKTSETFVVDSGTKVRLRTAGKPGSGHAGSIGDVKTGDHVVVIGTGSSTFTATGILDGVA